MSPRVLIHCLPLSLSVALPLIDLIWNLCHLNAGLPDFYGLALPARAFALQGAWPQTPYFPALYPLLLAPFGLGGSVLAGGYFLSCCGLMLALFAVRRLVLLLAAHEPSAGIEPGSAVQSAAAAAVLLAWLMPIWRVTAGSPSVDALYTGLGLWFLAAAHSVWQQRRYSPRSILLLWVCAFLLPLLRYHAVILVLPLAAALLLRVPLKSRWTALAILKASVAALLINHLGYLMAYGEPLPDVASLQLRCGIEFSRMINYESPQHLWDNYAAFAAHARQTPLLADYSLADISVHVERNLIMFLRQPAILLAQLGCLALFLLARRDTRRSLKTEAAELPGQGQGSLAPGSTLLCGWVLLYCLSLSPAYYTARAALLPALACLALLCAAACRLPVRVWQPVLALLLAGYLLGSRFAWQDFTGRQSAAGLGAELSSLPATEREAALGPIQELDPRVVISTDNPWCLPLQGGGSWLDDPAIPPQLLDGRPVPLLLHKTD